MHSNRGGKNEVEAPSGGKITAFSDLDYHLAPDLCSTPDLDCLLDCR